MKTLVSLSGGMDSATVLARALNDNGRYVEAVGFNYGSKHNPHELRAAENICAHYGIPFHLINLAPVMATFNSALMSHSADPVPTGHYEEDSMKQTVVPGRNIIFTSILAGLAMSEEFGEVWIGIHGGDHHIYPDCRPDFFRAMNQAIFQGTDKKVSLLAPFLYDNKMKILEAGFRLQVPYELTRTCYSPNVVACGKCGSCQERLAAFLAVGREDPIEYVTREILPKKE